MDEDQRELFRHYNSSHLVVNRWIRLAGYLSLEILDRLSQTIIE